MKKIVAFAAVAALVLGACTKTETYTSQTLADAVSFGAYSGRTITKAGPTDDMNLDALKNHGFGVFATYSGTANYSEATNDFMYNQLVNYDGSKWTYSPIKYWPNPTNGQPADAQKVSFFAYAPYADPEATAADNTYGITRFFIDGTTKHNMLEYIFHPTKPNVDLMWGYKTKTIDTLATPATVTYTINDNLTRTTDNVKFIFQHMLSKLGGSQEGTDPSVDPYTDASYVANGLVVKAAPAADPTDDYIQQTTGDFGTNTGTKITISKIVIASAPETDAISGQPVTDVDNQPISYTDAAQTGTLDLYTGEFNLTGAKNIKFSQTIANSVVDDPATPEDESTYSELADFLKEPTTGFANFAALPKGVVKKAINVYKDESNPIILVPGTKPVVDITVTYIVRTYDEKLPAGYSEVPQTVFGRIKFAEIKKNTKYNIVMILGLNDVKFEASVQDWATDGDTWHDANHNGVVDPGEITPGNTATQIGLPNNL